MDAHNFDSDWDYYDYLYGTEEEEDGGEDEQEVDGVGDDG